MNSKQLLCSSILIIAVAFSACRGPEAKENEISLAASVGRLSPAGDEKYVIDKKESVVFYKGSMLLASKGSHSGYVYLSKGELIMEKGQLTGGTMEVDMNTIEDEKHGSKNNLVDHLKSADFFEVEKFPIAAFAITTVAPVNDSTVNITGNLTIKGITHAVTFPATVKLKNGEVKNGVIHANGKLSIDRTKWDVVYKSGKVLGLNLADDIISDTIEFDVKIVARVPRY